MAVYTLVRIRCFGFLMIKSFKHKGLEQFFMAGKTKGIKADHVKKIRQILSVLDAANELDDIKSVIAFRCHHLTGQRKKEHAVWVNKNWRITFCFEGGDVHLTNYEDYHDGKLRR